ncbi:FAD-dependent monooxygenase [Nocardia cyriacigeorgica]|jgi:3-hydroxybenzoate 6-monooxygenase|uniref:FAD-dependent monooxygenase n=1 Tax=Nocardia cyriacigeorgica TaxID=135487 RepID=UPI000CEA61F1|nr:FAD-dependent monooxygenase [Nocardia cyriacigeorgica]AVH23431.1 3-hydroxybenzoate 6-hydroxylase [Nocardia cyriacigeorgica]MBF6323005.1 FAD-dependent monooxygenase [Nocardia cyriacigeorgica]MBF6497375.1 FAD-dependent monooxygenase [Nocardia cyriacigeorgica]PPJ15470.1 3-hydroxybenzoate 6-hydroxylase [Nocardia cyriacigeorgica]
MSSNDSAPDVLIVGGGIGGLGAAYALARQGLAIRVMEQAPEFGEVGAGLQLAPNCTRILDDYGLLDETRSLGVAPEAMIMRDAVDGTELTRLDLRDLEKRYGFPYLVIHRSDLHSILLRACERAGVDLVTGQTAVHYANTSSGARVGFADGHTERARVVIAADGLHSTARKLLVDDEPVSSAYVAYRGTVPAAEPRGGEVDLREVVVHVGPRCHFVHYGLRGGDLINQVAVFESPKALAGEQDWGTPDELDAAFAHTCDFVRGGLPHMWRDKWWRMYDRDPITTWVSGNIALLGDSAHPPLQYLAQGAIMAIEDGWVLAEQVRRQHRDGSVDWAAALAAYDAVRPEHCRRVVTTSRAWGELWHLDGTARVQRNTLLRARDIYDYSFVDWLYGPTALFPADEPPMFEPIPLHTAEPARA